MAEDLWRTMSLLEKFFSDMQLFHRAKINLKLFLQYNLNLICGLGPVKYRETQTEGLCASQ